MRASALRLLQRLPGAVAQDAGAFRSLASSSVIRPDASSLFASLHGRNQEQSFGAKLRAPGLSFASQLHTATDNEERQASAMPDVLSMKEVPRVPSALVALPPKSPNALARRGMASAAAADAAHNPYWVNHPYHVLPPSPWPALASYGVLVSCLGMTSFFHAIPGGQALMLTGLGCTTATAIAWWRDCIIESDMGMHTEVVKRNLMSGVWLFIVSEAALFFGLLWSCVHLGMQPNVNIQMQWPPVGIEAVGWDKRALVMSAVLAGSYYSANVAMVAKDPKMVMSALGVTLALGCLFLGDQYLEFATAPFNLTDGPYGTTFYITTGFHGMHVLLGAIWLGVSMAMYPRYNNPGVGMRGAILYWHFVDVVWIAVYGIIYVAQL